MGFREGQSHYSNMNLIGSQANMVINSYGERFKGKEFSESWITVCLYTLLSRDWLEPDV